jgi:CHAT domain-containing protein
MFRIAEKAKARVLLDNLANTNAHSSFTPNLETVLDLDPLEEKKKGNSRYHFDQTEDSYINMLNRRYINVDTFNDKRAKVSYVLQEIQSYLKKSNAVLFEYFLGDKRSYLFMVTGSDLKVFPLSSRTMIARSIFGYLKLLRSPPQGKFKGKIASKRIYKELLNPLDCLDPNSFENVIIIPSGVLYYLPFETLISPQKKDAYLVSRYKISYMPSSVSLLYLSLNRKVKTYKKDFIAFGNPAAKISSKNGYDSSNVLIQLYENQDFKFSTLPFSEKEIKSISKLFNKKRKDVFLREKASEEIIKKVTLSDYRIIHFSCHGFLDEDYPFRSSLVLSLGDGQGEDGFLQVREIYKLEMMPQLVVLSACHTGRGTLKRGEGVLGLPRVFFYAGAESILSSLWRVRDRQTAGFMNLFYRYLASGKSKAQSLQLAKIDFIESKKYSNPFYWAPFVLNGEFLGSVNF